MVARQHGDATQQDLTSCEKSSASNPLETKPHAREWFTLGSGISVSTSQCADSTERTPPEEIDEAGI